MFNTTNSKSVTKQQKYRKTKSKKSRSASIVKPMRKPTQRNR